MRFSLFDTTSWPHGTTDDSYNAELAKTLFEEHLEEYTRAEELGYDSIYLAEHHFSPYNLCPSPNLILAALSQRTRRIRMGVMVNVLTFHQPVRFAEETAMLDLLTGGRLDVGIGRGVDEHEFIKAGIPFSEARPRFEESLELALRLWQEEKVVHKGEFYALDGATIWPRPLQTPHPPIFVASLSEPTIRWAGRHGYAMASAFLTPEITRNRYEIYRDEAEAAGRTWSRDQNVLLRFVHVADSDEQAIEEARAAIVNLFELFIPAVVPQDLRALPDDYAYYKEYFAPFKDPSNPPPLEVLMDFDIVIAGSPETVQKKTREVIETSDTGHLLTWHRFGDLPLESVLRSEALFAEHAMPELRSLA